MNLPDLELTRPQLAAIPIRKAADECIALVEQTEYPYARYKTHHDQWLVYSRETRLWYVARIQDAQKIRWKGRCEPITKTDGQGRELLVGYRRKTQASKHARKEYYLRTPKVLKEASAALPINPQPDPRDAGATL